MNRRARPAVFAASAGALAACTFVLVPPAGATDRSAGPSATARCDVLSPGAAPGAQRAVREACRAQGTSYSWGGGHGAKPGPTTGHYNGNPASRTAASTIGFDCSGLVRWAYAKALGRDLLGPGDAGTYYARALGDGLRHIAPAQGISGLLPGDLLFYRNAQGTVHHVAMYIGAGDVVQAQRSGTEVGVSTADLGPEYIGAIRVATASGTPAAVLPPLPDAAFDVPAGLGPAMVRRLRMPAGPRTQAPVSRPMPRPHRAPDSKPPHAGATGPKPAPVPKPTPAPVPAPAPTTAPAPAPTPSTGLGLLGSGGVLDGVTTTLSGLLGGGPNG